MNQSTTIALVALALIVVAFLVSQTTVLRPVRDVLSQGVVPVQSQISRIARAVGALLERGRAAEDLQQENGRLRSQVDSLSVDNLHLKEAEAENASLRELLGFKQTHPSYVLLGGEVVGHVVGQAPTNLVQEVTIDLGTQDAIRSNMPVVTSLGLVGRVLEANPSSARVLLITDGRSAVGVTVQRSRATGLVEGRPGGRLFLTAVRQDESIAVGDIIETSGIGGIFPRGLIVGQISKVIRSDVQMFQEAEITPTASLSNLERVLVITSFEAMPGSTQR
jgi:rod shape-determining protein MreC